MPALKTIERLLALPGARALATSRAPATSTSRPWRSTAASATSCPRPTSATTSASSTRTCASGTRRRPTCAPPWRSSGSTGASPRPGTRSSTWESCARIAETGSRRSSAIGAPSRSTSRSQTSCASRRLARLTDDRLEHAVAHRAAGAIAFARGRRAEAIEAWTRAAGLLTEHHERFELARTLLELGRAVAEPREARRHLYRAGALFGELKSAWWMEQVETELLRMMSPAAAPPPQAPGSLLGRRHRAPSLVACSAPMRRVESLAQRAASTGLSVLITGETGTGKELIARTIHGLSPLAQRPFLAINAGALRTELALSPLFRHRRGRCTGA